MVVTFAFFPRENPPERASVERTMEDMRTNRIDNRVETLISGVKIKSDNAMLSAF